MSNPRNDEAYYQDLLYQLLPAVYRGRDKQGDLRRFLDLFGHEFARLRGNIDQLRRDLFIDSCQDWAIAYLADLVGTNIVFNEGARNRADVKNTIRWRRQKGTLSGLEDMGSDISGWGSLAVEMLERLIWSQNLNHLRAHAVHAVSLADGSRLMRLNTPFDLSCRSVDLRPPDQRVGWHQLPNVRFSLWAIPSHPWRNARPAPAGSRRYRFHPLALDQMLSSGGDKRAACRNASEDPARRADICFPHARDVFIRGRDFRDNPQSYFGQASGFSVYEDGILLCTSAETVATRSTVPLMAFEELAATGGMRVADAGLFPAGATFSIRAERLASTASYSPASPFATQFALPGSQGTLNTTTLAYTKGLAFQPGGPQPHHRVMLVAVERLGAVANFPESEIILRNHRGRRLLVYLPALNGLAVGQPFHLYVAEDGSAYFARATHDAGPVDRNPDASAFGAYLPRHLARESLGQARPRPGLRPVGHRAAVYRNLCCWDRPLARPPAPGEVAFDPERGRFVFPAGEEPSGELTVDFRFGTTGETGAGPYFRGERLPATLRVSKSADAPFQTIQAAINAAPAGSLVPVVIEIEDSRTYSEALTINQNFPGGLILQAGLLELPVLEMPVPPPPGNLLSVTGAASRVVLDGLVMSGGGVSVTGAVGTIEFRFCSLDPRNVTLTLAPAGLATAAIANTISGPITASANVSSLRMADSIVQHPAATVFDQTGQIAMSVTGDLVLDRVTVLGEVSARSFEASNTVLLGRFQVTDAAASCLRYSRYTTNAAQAATFRSTTAFPVFVSIRFGHPGYMHLHPNTSPNVRKGGEEGGEMGAFYRAGIPWREQNLGLKLDEYLPAGLVAVPVLTLPPSRFPGVIRV